MDGQALEATVGHIETAPLIITTFADLLADDPPQIDASPGSTSFLAGGGAVLVDGSLTITGTGSLSGARVVIENSVEGDTLGFTPQGGISGSYNSAAGVLSLSGTATVAQYQDVLRSVTFNNNLGDLDQSSRNITFTVGDNTLYLSSTGHYYEFVTGEGITWTNATAETSGRSLYGMQGYLATITSEGENAFMTSKLQGNGWIGARVERHEHGSHEGSQKKWQWVTGPENGSTFSKLEYDSQGGYIVETPGEAYSNWADGEPNDNGGDEDYAHLLGDGSWKGQWNDWPDEGALAFGVVAQGYVVEYGGMAGETMAVLSAAKTVAMSIPAKPIITVGVDDQFNDTAWDSWVPSSCPGQRSDDDRRVAAINPGNAEPVRGRAL
ncbi:MAG: Lectin C-type domain-containing protein [Rhodospirillaceae bacterium]|nr:MAG: Lectin C-type domain-containing protein [Rhodospirillaceae bacterium]